MKMKKRAKHFQLLSFHCMSLQFHVSILPWDSLTDKQNNNMAFEWSIWLQNISFGTLIDLWMHILACVWRHSPEVLIFWVKYKKRNPVNEIACAWITFILIWFLLLCLDIWSWSFLFFFLLSLVIQCATLYGLMYTMSHFHITTLMFNAVHF